jgi:hypothetical protein
MLVRSWASDWILDRTVGRFCDDVISITCVNVQQRNHSRQKVPKPKMARTYQTLALQLGAALILGLEYSGSLAAAKL